MILLMLVWSLFIIGHMGLFLYLKKPYNPYFGSLPTIEIIEPKSGTPIEIPALELHLGAETKLRYTGAPITGSRARRAYSSAPAALRTRPSRQTQKERGF